MRILYVLENYYPNLGGVETLFKSIAEGFAEQGHHVKIVTTHLFPETARYERQGNLEIVRMPLRNRYLFTFFSLFFILPHVRGCDVIHTTSYNAGLPAFIAAKLFRKKVIITFHEVWADLWFKLPWMGKISSRLHYLFEQMLVRLPFDRFVAVSQSTAAALERAGVAEHRIRMIYDGIDYRAFERRPRLPRKNESPFLFTYFGRLGISKGLELLIPAFADVHERHPLTRLQLIVPTVPEPFLADLKKLVQNHGVSTTTQFRHELSFLELQAAIRASDAVVIPSWSEGFCFAAVETVALGTPIVSSGRTALRETVTGHYVEMNAQTIEGLRDAMERAYRGEWEHRPIRYFHLQQTIEAYFRLYRELGSSSTRSVRRSANSTSS